MFKYLALIIVLLVSGCTINHQRTLDKRLSYASEKHIQKLNLAHPQWKIQGSELNLKVFSSIHNESGIGEGHRYHLDVGKTFNELLEQASNYAGYSCELNCNEITIYLLDVELNLNAGLFEGFNYAKISSRVKIDFPKQFKGQKSISKTYNFEIKDRDDLPPNTRHYSTQIYFLEKTITTIINELESKI
jgi:hypothetical protein